jgi:hypothetical protein
MRDIDSFLGILEMFGGRLSLIIPHFLPHKMRENPKNGSCSL